MKDLGDNLVELGYINDTKEDRRVILPNIAQNFKKGKKPKTALIARKGKAMKYTYFLTGLGNERFKVLVKN